MRDGEKSAAFGYVDTTGIGVAYPVPGVAYPVPAKPLSSPWNRAGLVIHIRRVDNGWVMQTGDSLVLAMDVKQLVEEFVAKLVVMKLDGMD